MDTDNRRPSLTIRVATTTKKRLNAAVRRGRPGAPLYFASASALVNAAIFDMLDRVEAQSNSQ